MQYNEGFCLESKRSRSVSNLLLVNFKLNVVNNLKMFHKGLVRQ